jgi:hypothetical protein
MNTYEPPGTPQHRHANRHSRLKIAQGRTLDWPKVTFDETGKPVHQAHGIRTFQQVQLGAFVVWFGTPQFVHSVQASLLTSNFF